MPSSTKGSRLALAFFLNLFFTLFEVVGGLYTGSVAILSDAVHDLGDAIAIGLSWILDVRSRRQPDETYTYGYGRYSLLGGMIASLVLVAGSVAVIVEAVPRLFAPQPVDAPGMVVFAIIGVLVNGAAAFHASRGRTANEKAVGLHLFEDVFGWVAVLLGAIAMWLWEVPILDALLSIAFTLYILFHVVRNLQGILAVFLERVPEGFTPERLAAAAVDGTDVLSIHHVHLWTVDGVTPLATFHAVVRPDCTPEELPGLRAALGTRLEQAGFPHATVEVECTSAPCDAVQCAPPEATEESHHHHS